MGRPETFVPYREEVERWKATPDKYFGALSTSARNQVLSLIEIALKTELPEEPPLMAGDVEVKPPPKSSRATAVHSRAK